MLSASLTGSRKLHRYKYLHYLMHILNLFLYSVYLTIDVFQQWTSVCIARIVAPRSTVTSVHRVDCFIIY